jgi:S1-C subfamily serine protease
LLVASVEAGSPAEKGGVLLGDVLLTMGGQALTSMDDLLAALRGEEVGKLTSIDLIRGGKATSLKVTIGDRPAPVEEDE